MPGARTHDMLTLITGVVLAVPTYTLTLQATDNGQVAAINTLILVGAHCVSGMLFSPDLDLDSSIDNRWGIFFWIWRPYMWVVPHRSRWLSHGLIVPALIRLAYFYVVVMGLLIAMAWVLARLGVVVPTYHITLTDFLRSLPAKYPRETASFLIGFITGGAVHTIADWLVTGGKHYLRRMGIRITHDYHDHDRWTPRRRRTREW